MSYWYLITSCLFNEIGSLYILNNISDYLGERNYHLLRSYQKSGRNKNNDTGMLENINKVRDQRFEPPRDKTNKMACAPSEDSDQLCIHPV